MTPLIWMSMEPPGHCVLDPTFIPNTRKLHAGEPVAGEFPKDVTYRMSDRFPDDLLLSDTFKVSGQILASSAMKTHLEAALPGHNIEYLPVTIVNHKQRVASSEYFIVHSLDVVDCIDVKKSKVKWNPLNKTTIMSCKGLVISSEAIPSHLRLFRPKHWGDNMMAASDLATALESSGFSGLRFIPAAGFTGIG